MFQATHSNPYVKWFVPARKHFTLLKATKRKDRLAYNADGEIILHDGYAPSAEFDGILRLKKKQIILIEMKYTLSGGREVVQKILSRFPLFKAAYRRDSILLLLIPVELRSKYSYKFVKSIKTHPRVYVIEVQNFTRFREMFESKTFPTSQKKLSQFSSKIKAPHEVFPRSINFSSQKRIFGNSLKIKNPNLHYCYSCQCQWQVSLLNLLLEVYSVILSSSRK